MLSTSSTSIRGGQEDVLAAMKKHLMTSEVNCTPLGKTVLLFFTFEGDVVDESVRRGFESFGVEGL